MRPRSILLAAAALAFPCRLGAQRLTATEVSIGGAVAVARHTLAAGELGLALRPGTQTRASLALAGGSEHGRAAARGQIWLQFLVTPAARSGVGVYTGVGTVFAVRRGSESAGFVAVLLGLEGAPGNRSGWQNWYVEGGLGGGIRAAAGWRFRWFPPWWVRGDRRRERP